MAGNDQPPADIHRAPAAQEVLVDERNGSWTEAVEHLADLGAVDRYWPSELLDEA
jgi:hypothetical protein